MAAKEILLYDDIYSYSARNAINELEEARDSSEIVVRFNGDGGEIRYGWAVLAKAKELKGKKLFKNDGEANSMYAFSFCYNENNEALDTSYFKFHRASYGLDYERSEYFTESDRKELEEKNAKLREAMEAKMDSAKFAAITKVSFDELFSTSGRIEVTLTAVQALECGLINRVIPLTPEYSAQVRALTAHFSPNRIAAHSEPVISTTMTKDEIQAKYPTAYKEIFAAGKKRGIQIEFDRADSIIAFAETDPKKAIEAFKSQKPLTDAMRTEFLRKEFSALSVKKLEGENADPLITAAEEVKPPAGAKTVVDAKLKADFNSALDKEFQNRFPNSKKVA